MCTCVCVYVCKHMLPTLLMTVFHGSYMCVSSLSLAERRAEKPQLACRVFLADVMFCFVFLIEGPDLESLKTVAVLFFHLDLTWI